MSYPLTTSRTVLINMLAGELFSSHGGKWDADDFARNLNDYSDDLLYRILSSNQNIRDRFHHVRTSILNGCSEDSIRERIMFLPEYSNMPYKVADQVIRSLHCYPQLPVTDNFASAGVEVLRQCSSLLMVMDAFRYCELAEAFIAQDPPYVIADQRIVDMIVATPEIAPELTNFIYERRTRDAELILEYFQSSTPALRDGAI